MSEKKGIVYVSNPADVIKKFDLYPPSYYIYLTSLMSQEQIRSLVEDKHIDIDHIIGITPELLLQFGAIEGYKPIEYTKEQIFEILLEYYSTKDIVASIRLVVGKCTDQHIIAFNRKVHNLG